MQPPGQIRDIWANTSSSSRLCGNASWGCICVEQAVLGWGPDPTQPHSLHPSCSPWAIRSPGMTENSTCNERSLPRVLGEPKGRCAHTLGIVEVRAGSVPEFAFHPTPWTRQEGRDAARFTCGPPEPSPEQASLNAYTHGGPTHSLPNRGREARTGVWPDPRGPNSSARATTYMGHSVDNLVLLFGPTSPEVNVWLSTLPRAPEGRACPRA